MEFNFASHCGCSSSCSICIYTYITSVHECVETERHLRDMAGSELINLASVDGAKLLSEVEAGHGSSCQSKLINIFTKQISRSSCGLVSSALVLSASRHDQSTPSKPAFTEQNMLSMPATLTVISQEKMSRDGNKCSITET